MDETVCPDIVRVRQIHSGFELDLVHHGGATLILRLDEHVLETVFTQLFILYDRRAGNVSGDGPGSNAQLRFPL